MTASPLVTVTDLDVSFPVRGFRKPPIHVLHKVSIEIAPAETLGLVGESGSGKTTLGRAMLGLAPVSSGSIVFDGEDISHANRRDRKRLAAKMQVVFQDPYTSLNPVMLVDDILREPLRVHGKTAQEASDRVAQLLDQVGLPRDSGRRLPREFSGGQRQRIAIARALALSPQLIVCDEPCSALDLSTQARILDLLIDIQRATNVAYLFVSHDLSVVRHISHRVAVMYKGEIVESGDGEVVTTRPTHPYTRRLLMAAPVSDPGRQAERRRARRAALATTPGPSIDAAHAR